LRKLINREKLVNNNETILRKENLVIDTEAQQNSAEQLVKRILPDHYKFFDLKISNDVSEDYFIIKDHCYKLKKEKEDLSILCNFCSSSDWRFLLQCGCHILYSTAVS